MRVDTAVTAHSRVAPHYDSLIAKLIVHGIDRSETLRRLRWALDQYVIEGIQTNIPFHRRLLVHRPYVEGRLNTGLLNDVIDQGEAPQGRFSDGNIWLTPNPWLRQNGVCWAWSVQGRRLRLVDSG